MRQTILALTLALSGTAAQAADIVMHRSAGCGCCLKWVEKMVEAGHEVDVVNEADLMAFKAKHGVPMGLASCHTSLVGGYVVEGHVPAADIERLLAEKPEAVGLFVPGMPMGSPGMEHGDHVQPYNVLLLKADGTYEIWASHG
ncbi:DUF411 domain-containing protein [Sphingomicrobium astaxanthinifaciens]|uniref:DUF411 domain-containing protein n=1 Tax=Sphingomicrobium astaxanthinifaciens TaxID=1227949 RepID=UPI001FCC8216|nr:DUF411 domain-containing protein [Sphingomicrobium astaxanthinifaciens]MCJ7420714.1 DUF411 domain-containing protein [Sphingomicrobium astaxanthinifaciens]